MNAIVKYPGSKYKIAKEIINLFPPHHSYLEPFFGGGAVLFNKERSNIETINDLDGNVVNLFECIRTDPEKLARIIYMTPYSREVYDKAYQKAPADKFEAALYFCIRLNMGYGCRTTGKVGWKNDVQGREKSYASYDWYNLPEKIMWAAERLRGVQIENMPALKLIPRFNYKNVLIYCDPPYMLQTRHGKQYLYEMNDKDHEMLLDVLLKHRGYVIISGYDTELYNSMLTGWTRYELTSYSQTGSKKTEILWMNFRPYGQQITLCF